jgi:hypothetical protein
VPEQAAADPGADEGDGLDAAVEGVADSVGVGDGGAADDAGSSPAVEADGSSLVEGGASDLPALAGGALLVAVDGNGPDGMHAPSSSATKNRAIKW